jgi:mannose-1-phosphate guanylyltransferase
MKMVLVILSGDSGTQLWPLSSFIFYNTRKVNLYIDFFKSLLKFKLMMI